MLFKEDERQPIFVSLFSGKVRWEDGRVSGAVYSGEEKLTKLLVKVMQCVFKVIECVCILKIIPPMFVRR